MGVHFLGKDPLDDPVGPLVGAGLFEMNHDRDEKAGSEVESKGATTWIRKVFQRCERDGGGGSLVVHTT